MGQVQDEASIENFEVAWVGYAVEEISSLVAVDDFGDVGWEVGGAEHGRGPTGDFSLFDEGCALPEGLQVGCGVEGSLEQGLCAAV